MTKHEELERLARAATPGPYVTDENQCVVGANGDIVADYSMAARGHWEADAAFVTAALNAVPALLSANREMREALEAIEATATEFHETGRDRWGHAEIEECMSADEVRALARSALTTQRGDGE